MLKTEANAIIGGDPFVGDAPRLKPLAVDIPEACRLTGLGRSKLYELLSTGEIRSITVGRRRLIPVAALRDWLDRLETGPSQAV
jgi:excisionase family DNA binding protein